MILRLYVEGFWCPAQGSMLLRRVRVLVVCGVLHCRCRRVSVQRLVIGTVIVTLCHEDVKGLIFSGSHDSAYGL